MNNNDDDDNRSMDLGSGRDDDDSRSEEGSDEEEEEEQQDSEADEPKEDDPCRRMKKAILEGLQSPVFPTSFPETDKFVRVLSDYLLSTSFFPADIPVEDRKMLERMIAEHMKLLRKRLDSTWTRHLPTNSHIKERIEELVDEWWKKNFSPKESEETGEAAEETDEDDGDKQPLTALQLVSKMSNIKTDLVASLRDELAKTVRRASMKTQSEAISSSYSHYRAVYSVPFLLVSLDAI